VSDWYLFQGVASVIIFHRVVGPNLFGLPTDEAAVAAAMPKAHVVFAELARLLGEESYLAGDAVSLADFMVAPHIDFFAGLPEWEPLMGPHANLRDWLQRMNARPSMLATTWEKVAEMAAA
jgi:glutathione S-transferase